MVEEIRTIDLDPHLHIEAYQFKGIMQKFPAHFNEYYVIGFIEEGQRSLICKGETYMINPGDMVIFNPYDTHSCEQVDGKTLDYRCINVPVAIMQQLIVEISGQQQLPYFTENVLVQSELVANLKELHTKISQGEHALKKEELFFYLVEELICKSSDVMMQLAISENALEMKDVCTYLDEHHSNSITLNELSDFSGYSKYHLLRIFTKKVGISPNSYLETIRINQAKQLLQQGIKPIEVAHLLGKYVVLIIGEEEMGRFLKNGVNFSS